MGGVEVLRMLGVGVRLLRGLGVGFLRGLGVEVGFFCPTLLLKPNYFFLKTFACIFLPAVQGKNVDPVNIVLLSDIQKDEAKLALLHLAVRISGLKAKSSSEDPHTVLSSTTDLEGTYDEEDFEKFLDQQDQKARSKLMLRSRESELQQILEVGVGLLRMLGVGVGPQTIQLRNPGFKPT